MKNKLHKKLEQIALSILLNSFLMQGFYYVRRDFGGKNRILLWTKIFSYSLIHWIRKKIGKIDIVETTFIISTRCTLRCRDCHNLIPWYHYSHKAMDFPLEEITEDLTHLLDCVDSLKVLVLIGGETFLHKNLPEILDFINIQKKIKKLVIVSNGTISPSDKIISSMQRLKNRVKVVFSNYGSTAPKTQEIADKLHSKGICVQIGDADSNWTGTGVVKDFKRSPKSLQQFYQSCPMKCNAYLHGNYYVCDQTAHRTDTGMMPLFDEVIQVRNINREAFKKKYSEFIKSQSFLACNYCGYHSGHPVPPAVQVTSIEEYEKTIGHAINEAHKENHK